MSKPSRKNVRSYPTNKSAMLSSMTKDKKLSAIIVPVFNVKWAKERVK